LNILSSLAAAQAVARRLVTGPDTVAAGPAVTEPQPVLQLRLDQPLLLQLAVAAQGIPRGELTEAILFSALLHLRAAAVAAVATQSQPGKMADQAAAQVTTVRRSALEPQAKVATAALDLIRAHSRVAAVVGLGLLALMVQAALLVLVERALPHPSRVLP
jgi:hypothetical protein